MSDRNVRNIVLGAREDGTVVVLESTFGEAGKFRGATGAEIVPVTKAEWDRVNTDEEKSEYYEELWRNDAGRTNGTLQSLEEWVNDIDEDEYLESRFEDYRDIDADDIAAALGVEEPMRYTPIGMGRIFPRALEGVTFIDSDEVRAALAAIAEFEQE